MAGALGLNLLGLDHEPVDALDVDTRVRDGLVCGGLPARPVMASTPCVEGRPMLPYRRRGNTSADGHAELNTSPTGNHDRSHTVSEVSAVPRPGRTTARGHGYTHRQQTARLKADMRDGQPCARGGEPLYRWQLDLPAHHPQSIEGDHATAYTLGGRVTDTLSCAHHNRSHGAHLGNHLRRTRSDTQPPRRRRPHTDPLHPSRDW